MAHSSQMAHFISDGPFISDGKTEFKDGNEGFKAAKTRGEFYTQDFESPRRKPNFLTYKYCTRVRIITLWSLWRHKERDS